MTTPIGPSGPRRTSGVSGPARAEAPKSTDRVQAPFAVPPGGSAAAASAGSSTPTFDAMKARILEGASRGLSREQILHELATHELMQMTGGKVTPAMSQWVADAVMRDPQLAPIYSKLLKLAQS